METYENVKDFWEYLEYYPDEDEPGFDGIHYGGIKGIAEDAPEPAKKAFEKYREEQAELAKRGIKI